MKVKAKILYLPNYNKSWGPMKYAYNTDTGFDIRACNTDDIILKSYERCLIPTGFKIAIEPGYALQIRPRSGNAIKLGLSFANAIGTIDNEYRGEICVIAINLGTELITIQKGMRIAQGVIEPVIQCEFEEVNNENDLSATQRSDKGFGSSGTN